MQCDICGVDLGTCVQGFCKRCESDFERYADKKIKARADANVPPPVTLDLDGKISMLERIATSLETIVKQNVQTFLCEDGKLTQVSGSPNLERIANASERIAEALEQLVNIADRLDFEVYCKLPEEDGEL